MEFRLATVQDLDQIRSDYQKLVRHMNAHQLSIWDEVYPCCLFEEDIHAQRLYLLLDGGEFRAAFALCDRDPGEASVMWTSGKALYLDRLGVSAEHLGKGIGAQALARAKETARALGAEALRLFVADTNRPAVRLYEKAGFRRVAGTYQLVIDEDLTLNEYGYEAIL